MQSVIFWGCLRSDPHFPDSLLINLRRMLHKSSNCCHAACRQLTHLMVCVAIFVAFGFEFGSTSFAAGCAHPFDYTTKGQDPFGNPLANNVQKVYSGGQFHYYVVAVGGPCNGPNCKGAPTPSLASVPLLLTNDRSDLTLITSSSGIRLSHFCERSKLWPAMRPISQVHDGLLRPPTA